MSCSYPNREELLVSYAYDELDVVDKQAFAIHLAGCDACRSEATGLVGLRDQLATWSPPELLGSAVKPQQPPVASHRRWTELPAWMQVAAAVLVLGVSAGAANLHIDIGSRGLSVRTGWMEGGSAIPPSTAAVSQADLASVRREFQGTIESLSRKAPALIVPAHTSDDDMLRRARALIASSEKRQQAELALRLGEMRQDIQIQRTADLIKIDQRLNVIDRGTVALNRQTINTINTRLAQTVSQTQAR